MVEGVVACVVVVAGVVALVLVVAGVVAFVVVVAGVVAVVVVVAGVVAFVVAAVVTTGSLYLQESHFPSLLRSLCAWGETIISPQDLSAQTFQWFSALLCQAESLCTWAGV